MADFIMPSRTPVLEHLKPTALDRAARRMVLGRLARIERGQLILVENGRRRTFGRVSDRFPLAAVVTIEHFRCYAYMLFGGSIGSAEAYMAGLWQADDMTTAMRIMLLNRRVFEGMEKGWARLSRPLHLAYHLVRKNTEKKSRQNITAHYDLGNDFYALFLDETMTYSCGIFADGNPSLKAASLAKYDRICRKLMLGADDHVLEIGTGWGGFALYAVQHYACRVTSTTISNAQHALALERIKASGLADRVQLLREDYRALRGRFDKLVSIEMIEAVGHQYLDTFFKVCSRLLKDDGMMLLQAITIQDQVFERHKRSVDFIKRYIFPGSCIPSIGAMSRSIAKATDMKLFHLEDITPHYALTLAAWRRRFERNIDKVKALGFSDAFMRMWIYYLCYCEAGFSERYIGDVQMLLTKPLCRREPLLPDLT